MEPIRILSAVALPWPGVNCDTDQIIPARYLQKPRSDNFGDYLFYDLRFDEKDREVDAFPLNTEPLRHARIVVAGRNFGCGSSREHAVWALYDYGFRAVVAPTLGDIFTNNCLKNGVVPIQLPEDIILAALDHIARHPGAEVTVDLPNEQVTMPNGDVHDFAVDPFAKDLLVNGIDELGYTLSLTDAIEDFEQRHKVP